ncbi:MAG: hypothetical protein WCT10_01910 [Patescibacteria group bacterium]|jgi:hypothetical protein
MKTNLWIAIVALCATFSFTACGVQESGDEDSACTDCVDIVDPVDPVDPVTPAVVMPAPFKSPTACVLDFSSAYVSGSTCGELRGDIRGTTAVTWTDGPHMLDSDNSGYIGMAFTDAPDAGTYNLSYVGWQNCSTQSPNEAWAQFGDIDQLKAMTSEARAFIQCNWWNASTREMVTGVNPSCSIRVTFDAACNITPAGNMANLE